MPHINVFVTDSDLAAAVRIAEKMNVTAAVGSADIAAPHVLASAISEGMLHLRKAWEADPIERVVPKDYAV